jgi:hypothetical protein
MVSTSIPTLSIAAISSAKAQTHTEYYIDEHAKIGKVDATQDILLSPRAEPPRATRSPPQAASAGTRPPGGPLPTTPPPAGRSGTSGGCCCCSRRSTEGGQIGNKSERSTRGSRTRCSAYGKVPTLAGGLWSIIEGLRVLRRLARRPRPCLPAAPAPRDSNDTTR